MNQLKQAIAYLVSKIQTAYYAARFFTSIIFWEIPHGHHRVVHKDIRGGVRGPDRETSYREVEAGSDRPVEPVREQKAVDNADLTCDELLGFWAGDPIDRLYDCNNQRSASPQGSRAKNLRDEPETQQCIHAAGDWDSLEPRDRQAVILDKMREHQSKMDLYCVLSTRDVVELCGDRAEWDTTFDDLMGLSERRSVKINIVDCDRTGKFLGLFWGLC